MFCKKQVYEIIWEGLSSYKTLIVARNESQALKKFYRQYGASLPSIVSFKKLQF